MGFHSARGVPPAVWRTHLRRRHADHGLELLVEEAGGVRRLVAPEAQQLAPKVAQPRGLEPGEHGVQWILVDRSRRPCGRWARGPR